MKHSEYLVFEEQPQDPKRKTKTWVVLSRSSGIALGTIKWYGAWRQYCFYPRPSTIFNRGCLNDIIDFIEVQMEARKAYRGKDKTG